MFDPSGAVQRSTGWRAARVSSRRFSGAWKGAPLKRSTSPALAERRIAQAEAQASAEVKAAAADLAARAAEQILTARVAGQKTDPLLDAAIAQIGTRLN